MKKSTILMTAVILLLSYTCTIRAEKTYLPIEERLRPLSLPQKTWKIDVGAEFGFGEKDSSIKFDFDPSLSSIQIPYLPIGNRTELHFLTPVVKLYLLKSVSVKDDFSIIDGPNLAFVGGITSVSYSSEFGFDMKCGAGYQFKSLLSDRSWFFTNANGVWDLKFGWGSNLTISTGFQITEKFSLIFSLQGSIYRFIVYSSELHEIIDRSNIGYTLKLPVDFKVNENRLKGFLIRTGFKYTSNTYNHSVTWVVPIGLQYSWHW